VAGRASAKTGCHFYQRKLEKQKPRRHPFKAKIKKNPCKHGLASLSAYLDLAAFINIGH
jgi:hypothetical protein